MSEPSHRPGAGVLPVRVILGMGGVGKSAFAAALAHNMAISDRFPDGVLWATLGQQPDLLPLLSGWVQALGDYQFRPLSLETTTHHLRSLLHDKAVLLVVDDAWAPAHVTPFLVGGPRSQILVTTREAAIARALGVIPFDLDVLTPEQSLALLAGRLGRALGSVEMELASSVATAVGYLPLALELTAAQVADGIPWSEIRDDLSHEVARLAALDLPGADEELQEALRKRLSLLASLHLSLRRLTEPDQGHFAWLGVLPEDVTLAPAMAATLWETDARSARTTLRSLRDRALLLPGVPRPDGSPTYRLHDLLHDLARQLLTTPAAPNRPGELPGLGLPLGEAHSHLLDRYQLRTQANNWHTLPDDGYIHERLTFHLERAGREDEIHALLREETPAGRNGWYEARERLGQVAGYLTDLGRALAQADRGDTNVPLRIGRVGRYAMLTASLNSMAANVLPGLLDATVERGVWPLVQALAYARQIPDRLRRAEALARLIPRLSEPEPGQVIREALEGVKELRPQVLLALAPHLAPHEIEEALTAVQASRDEMWQVDALWTLAPHLPPHRFGDALGTLRTMDPHSKAETLVGLAEHLAEPWIPEAFEMARRIRQDWARARAIEALAPRLTPALAAEARRAVRAIKTAWPRTRVLVALAARSSPGDLAGALQDALNAARTLQPAERRAEALAKLAAHAASGSESKADEILREALGVVQGCDGDSERADALTAIAPHLTRSVVAEALELAQRIGTKWDRDKALIALAPHMRPSELDSALQSLRTSPRDSSLGEFLAAIPPELLTPALCEEALEAAKTIPHEESRSALLAALAPRLAGRLVAQALEISRTIGDEEAQIEALVKLAEHLDSASESPRVLDEALALAATIENEPRRSRTLISLAPHLGSQAVARARWLAEAIEHPWSREQALAALDRPPDTSAARQDLETLRRMQAGMREIKALGGLKFRMKSKRLDEVLTSRRDVSDGGATTKPEMTADERESVLREAIDVAPAIDDEAGRAEAILTLARHLPPSLLDRALEVVRNLNDQKVRAAALARLTPYLRNTDAKHQAIREALRLAKASQDLEWKVEALIAIADLVDSPDSAPILQDALDSARQIMRDRERAEALATLVPRLRPSQLAEALELAGAIGDGSARSAALTALAPRLAELDSDSLLDLWNPLIQLSATRTRQSLLRDLSAFTPVLDALGGEPAIAEICRAIQDVGRWWP